MDKDGNARCCPIGSNCIDNSACKSTDYQCVREVTVTVTATGTETGTETGIETGTETETGTESVSVKTETGCCSRRCPATSSYLCPSDLGGGCCGYESECRTGSKCVRTLEPSVTKSLTPVVEGCTTRQYKCEDGVGCCDEDRVCTQISNEGFCAPGEPTGAEIIGEDDDGGELSDGAKAGMSVGIVVAAAAVIGGVTWLCLRKRKKRKDGTAAQTRSRGAGGASGVGGGGGGSGSESRGPQRDDAVMTEVSVSTRPGQVGRGLTRDYFGPDPVAGPFTEWDEHSAATPPGPGRAVPSRPQDPGDIAAPVEIDSKSALSAEGRMSPVSTPSPLASPYLSDTIEGRFELYGSEIPLPNRPPSIVATPPISPRMDGSRPLSQS